MRKTAITFLKTYDTLLSGEADFLRIPLLKPYEAIKGDEKTGWNIDLDISPSNEATYYISIKAVQKIAIQKGNIFIYTPYEEEMIKALGEKELHWFILNPKQGIEKGFENESDFLQYAQEKGIIELSWQNPDEVFHQFEKTGCLEWIPDCK